VTPFFLVGLTGVGKSTAVGALQSSAVPLTLLPNRRVLADTLMIPEVQRAAGEPVRAVTDRVERFALTRRYRERYPGGVVHALGRYQQTAPPTAAEGWVFDNLRGLGEVTAAAKTFPDARFIVLYAPPLERLLRLIGRHDRFDRVAATRLENSSFAEHLMGFGGLETVFDPYELARLEARGIPEADILNAVRIIMSEAEHYDMSAATTYLRGEKDAAGLLQLDTADLSVAEVQARVRDWL